MGPHDVKIFLPVKILNKQWANKLLDGSVFIRSLNDFGVWNLDAKIEGQAKEMDNSFRGDIREGLVINVDPNKGDSFFNSIFTPEIKAHIPNMWYTDENFFKYFKIYCMYCLTYNKNQKQFEQPDEKLKDFGDTAVIIYNPDAFLIRILQKLYDNYGDNIDFKINKVSYYDISKNFGNFDIFWKEKWYEWQNEVRMAIGLLDGSGILIQDTNPLTLEIGNIKDIAVAIPIENLINLKLPSEIVIPD